MASSVRGRTRCSRTRSLSASSPVAAIAAARVRFSSPSWPLIARRVPADRASGCSSGTAAATPPAPIAAAAVATARSGPIRPASEVSSSATSIARWRLVAASSAKLKSTSTADPSWPIMMLPPCSDRCAILARCSRPTSRHRVPASRSVIRSAGTWSRDVPATRSMVSSTDPSPALMTWPTCGTATPARSVITPSSASCSTALTSEAAGLVSPTPRSRMPRQARYSRSASR